MTTSNLESPATGPEAEKLGLLEAILADPEDDTPRLIYADWLEDRGESTRADFIRAQVELALLPEDSPLRPALLATEERLWNEKFKDGPYGRFVIGNATLPFGIGVPDCIASEAMSTHGSHRLIWTRGFPGTVRCNLADWMAHGKAVVRRHPITRVELHRRVPAWCKELVWTGSSYEQGASSYSWNDHCHDDGPSDADTAVIPWEVGVFLKARSWPSPDEAIDALSDALLAFARGR